MKSTINVRKLYGNWEIVGVFLLSFITRLFKISSEPLHIDEYAQSNVYSLSLGELTKMAFSWGRHPPLDFYIGKFVTEIFGFSTLSLRLPSAIFGAATSLFIYLLLFNRLDKNSARIGALFSIFWFPAVFYAQYVRPYSIFLFLFVLSLYLITRTKDNKKTMMYFYCSVTLLLWSRGGDGAIASLFVWLAFLIKNRSTLFTVRHQKWQFFYLLNFSLIAYAMNKTNHSIIFSNARDMNAKIVHFPEYWFALINYGSINFSIIIGIAIIVLCINTRIRNEIGLIYAIVFTHSLTSVFFLGVFSNQGIYPRYQVIHLILIAISFAVIYSSLKNLRNYFRYGPPLITTILLIYSITLSISERSHIHNYSFDLINSALKNNHKVVAYILGRPDQYLPGWPQISNELAGNIPNWLPEYAINRSSDFTEILILAKPDDNLGFLPVTSSLTEYQNDENASRNFRSDAVLYRNLESGLLKIESLSEKDANNRWVDLALIKTYSLAMNEKETTKRVNKFCKTHDLYDKIDLGPAWGQWGKVKTLAQLLNENNILLDCKIGKYAR